MSELKDLYWLNQWKEIRDLARHIIKHRQSPDTDIQICLLECELEKFPKSELEDRLMKILMSKIPPVDFEERGKQGKLFNFENEE